MEIRILGPMCGRHEAVEIVPSARKPRQVLALLLLHESEIVPVTSLINELWGGSPPRSAMTTLQTYVLQLRKAIGAALGMTTSGVAQDILVTRNGGYKLNFRSADFDMRKYHELERRGFAALRSGDDATTSDVFDSALALWRGPAITDVEPGRLIEAQVARLDQSRLTMLEYRIDAQIRLGRHRELLSELSALVIEHPFNENLHAQYMLALHRSGRRKQALETYLRLRCGMIEELGLEPAPRLQTLHQAVLSAEPSLDPALSPDPLPTGIASLASQRRL